MATSQLLSLSSLAIIAINLVRPIILNSGILMWVIFLFWQGLHGIAATVAFSKRGRTGPKFI